MPLFLILERHGGELRSYIGEANTMLYARLNGAMAGVLDPGKFAEIHDLPANLERKVPKAARGRFLTAAETRALLRHMSETQKKPRQPEGQRGRQRRAQTP